MSKPTLLLCSASLVGAFVILMWSVAHQSLSVAVLLPFLPAAIVLVFARQPSAPRRPRQQAVILQFPRPYNRGRQVG